MFNVAENIVKLRKARNWSQTDIANEIGTSRVMIGKYERGDNLPSLEALSKLADAFEVSIDYLVGKGINAAHDKRMLTRLEDIEGLDPEDKARIFHYIDLIIRDAKTRKAYSL